MRTRITARDYMLDFGTPDGATELASYAGFDLLDQDTVVLARWLNEDGTWLITDVVQLPT